VLEKARFTFAFEADLKPNAAVRWSNWRERGWMDVAVI
jgi:hypothetical protein